MGWSYSDDPAESEKDEVRFWLQDTTKSFPLLSDEDIEFLLGRYEGVASKPLYVASVAADRLAARFAREVNVSADGVSVSVGELQNRYRELAVSLRAQWKDSIAPGDMELANRLEASLEQDYSIPPLVFGTGFTDNWEAGRQDYGRYSPGEAMWPEVAPGV